MVISGGRTRAEILAWTIPDADLEVYKPATLPHATDSARMVFAVTHEGWWHSATDTVIFDAMLTHLPVDAISTLTIPDRTRLSKKVWLSHAPRLVMLKRIRLVPCAFKEFRKMHAEDPLPDSPPRLPQLTKLVLLDVSLTTLKTYQMRGMLIKRVDVGDPEHVLDPHMSTVAEWATQSLAETVGDAQGPAETPTRGEPDFSDWQEGLRFDSEEEGSTTDDDEHDGGTDALYGDAGRNEDEVEEGEWDDYDYDTDPHSDEF
jgi:hypothetical protein